jgi:hypothetical protein
MGAKAPSESGRRPDSGGVDPEALAPGGTEDTR